MIGTFIRQDTVFRRMPFWAVMATVWAGVSTGLFAWMTARGGSVELNLLAVVIWVAVAMYLVFGEIGTRTNRVNLSLPVSARTLWLSHVIAVSLTGAAVLVVSAGVTTGSLYAIGKLTGEWRTDGETLLVLGGLLAAALLLAVTIVGAFRRNDHDVPLSLARAGWSLAAAAVPLGLVLLLEPLGVFGVVIVLALVGAVFVHEFRAVPEALSVPPRRQTAAVPARETVGDPVSWEATQSKAGLWFALRVVHGMSTCAKKSAIWIIAAFLLFLGFWMSGMDGEWDGDTQRFAYPFMVVYVLMAATTMPIRRLAAVDWLPWSRRRILALFAAPLFVCVATGYGAGRISAAIIGNSGGEPLCFVEDQPADGWRMCIVPGACEISWAGVVPAVTSPDGETHEAWSAPVVKGLPVRIIYPYHAPAGSSNEFIAWQISRAAAAIYGADIPAAEIRSRYLDGAPAESRPELTLQADYPEMASRASGVYFPWLMATVILWWSLLTVGYLGFLRAGTSERRRKVMGVVFIALPMLIWIMDFVLEATGFSEIFVRNALIMNLARRVGESTAATIGVWAGSALLAWGAYRLVERRFDRAELAGGSPAGRTTGCGLP